MPTEKGPAMIERSNLSLLTTVVVLLCAPTTIALSLSMLTKDDSFRPFSGVSEAEKTTLVPSNGGPVVVARINWPVTAGDNRQGFATKVKRSFAAKGVPAVVEMVDTNGGGQITYFLESNTIGPFSLQDAAAGINATVSAYRIHPFTRNYKE